MSTAKQLRGTEETLHVSATIHRTVNTLPVAANLAYFQVEHKVDLPEDVPANLRQHFKPVLESGFATPAEISAYLDDQSTDLKAIPGMRVVPPGFRETMQRNRFMDAFEVYQAAMLATNDHLGGLQSGTISLDDIVRLETSSHMLFDRHGEVLPVGFYFDYSNGGFHSGRYDIDKALAILAKDPRVSPAPIRGKPQVGGLTVRRVADHFSTDDYSQRHIAFMFAPTVEDMRAIWAKCQTYEHRGSYPFGNRYDAIFDLDILGLRAGGATKYADFWSTDEVQTDTE